ncbi:sphingolipid long chain base-responsive protein PIL1 [Arthroderma uncinatum]|uniref:sphingolipid long chain base-responsive protein PIL1 n=1 Tax=Arthroderma uncinatum TaxID=74035 RepID=UPI00144A755C|nr:sphingolipid long chain base-responsive protein PIL1 [Arthroderma uncinatum]KAF3484385.1 sphingolipid long chain base-responsive protein PIL1 [Arthroderma uncinatum]
MATLRGVQQPELSKDLYKVIKTESHAISSYKNAGRDRVLVASQLADWGFNTGDPAVSEISDKLGILLSEIGEQEDLFTYNLEEARTILKHIRNTEGSVQPARDHKAKIIDEIQKNKLRDPDGAKVTGLEQELVRAEARALVAEAQLTNMTRQKFKQAFDMHLASTIERAEKQAQLARHGRRLLALIDDTPVVPGEGRGQFDQTEESRQIMEDAESDLKSWEAELEPVPMASEGLIPRKIRAQTNGNGVNGDAEKDEIDAI